MSYWPSPQHMAPSRHHQDVLRNAVAVYCDGGCIGPNPSPIGGTWAWCAVGVEGRRIAESSGRVLATSEGEGGGVITNNHMEYLAVVMALEALPPDWTGRICTDSQITLGRVFADWAERGIPEELVNRKVAAIMRLSLLSGVLLQGHPTKEDLARGYGAKRGYPVSIHNVWCDKECGRRALEYMEEHKNV